MAGEYTIGDHPSDLELTVRGRDLAEIFSAAARAVGGFITPRPGSGRPARRAVRLSAPDREELLVVWLNEILFLIQDRQFKPRRFRFQELSETALRAVGEGRNLTVDDLRGGSEIKAATYHDLSLRETLSGWVAHVTLDL